MPLEDKATRRRVEHELSKWSLDFNLVTVSVISEVAYFTGRVRPLRGPTGRGTDTKREMVKVVDAVKTLPGVKDVVLNVDFD